jgi:hypothetical protein
LNKLYLTITLLLATHLHAAQKAPEASPTVRSLIARYEPLSSKTLTLQQPTQPKGHHTPADSVIFITPPSNHLSVPSPFRNTPSPKKLALVCRHTSASSDHAITALTVLCDGRIASGDEAGNIELWCPEKLALLAHDRAYNDECRHILSTKNYLISTGINTPECAVYQSGYITFHGAISGTVKKTFRAFETIDQIVLSPNQIYGFITPTYQAKASLGILHLSKGWTRSLKITTGDLGDTTLTQATGELSQTVTKNILDVRAESLATHHQTLLVGCEDGSVRAFDFKGVEEKSSSVPHRILYTHSPKQPVCALLNLGNGKIASLAYGYHFSHLNDGSRLIIHSLTSPSWHQIIRLPYDSGGKLASSPAGNLYIFSQTRKTEIKKTLRIFGPTSTSFLYQKLFAANLPDDTTRLAVLPNERIATGHSDGVVRIWSWR